MMLRTWQSTRGTDPGYWLIDTTTHNGQGGESYNRREDGCWDKQWPTEGRRRIWTTTEDLHGPA